MSFRASQAVFLPCLMPNFPAAGRRLSLMLGICWVIVTIEYINGTTTLDTDVSTTSLRIRFYTKEMQKPSLLLGCFDQPRPLY